MKFVQKLIIVVAAIAVSLVMTVALTKKPTKVVVPVTPQIKVVAPSLQFSDIDWGMSQILMCLYDHNRFVVVCMSTDEFSTRTGITLSDHP